MFAIVFGLAGIPTTMIIIANIGQHISCFAELMRRQVQEVYKRRERRKSRAKSLSITGQDTIDEDDSSVGETMSVGFLLTLFLLYMAVGAVILPLLNNGEFDFLNGVYFNFICLTAIDFGQVVPTRY